MFHEVQKGPGMISDVGYLSNERTLLTIVGENASIEGKFKILKSISIDCEVKGELEISGKITVQKNGFVSADINTVDAEITGRFEGNLQASGTVLINETGFLSGNIKTNSLIINKGAMFSGTVTRIDEIDINK
ncbi:MAG: polymer-forming cytoskeletal protein [Actinobacteria bacterium]|nr:polymer-forming cytoskeletal protein [Actinomycetota bacterium]